MSLSQNPDFQNLQAKFRDFNLIKKILKGDKNSFAELMTFYKTRIFIFGKSFFYNDEDANDFVQDVFIKVFLNLKSFKWKSSFSTWLMRIAYTTAVNSVNRKKNYLPLSEEVEIPSKSLTPEEVELEKVTKSAVKEAVKDLPEKYKLVVDMYFFYDVPYLEISRITELPINTIKSHIFRAKKILKEKLEVYYEK